MYLAEDRMHDSVKVLALGVGRDPDVGGCATVMDKLGFARWLDGAFAVGDSCTMLVGRQEREKVQFSYRKCILLKCPVNNNQPGPRAIVCGRL